MALRIFQVSTDGVAVAVTKDEARGEPPSPKAGQERWSGASEWDRLRARLLEQPPLDERRASRRR